MIGQEQKKYVITSWEGKVLSCLLKDEKAIEFHLDPYPGQMGESALRIGDIYIGKIKNIAKNLNAAFVDLGHGSTTYLDLDKCRHPVYTRKGSSPHLQQGDELLVQVVREGIKSKYPAVSTELTLYGEFALLQSQKGPLSISSKLDHMEKTRLKQLAGEVLADLAEQAPDEAAGYGDISFLLRTNADGVEKESLEQEFSALYGQWKKLLALSPYRSYGSRLYSLPAPFLSRLTNLYHTEYEVIETDDSCLYELLTEWLVSSSSGKIRTEKLHFRRDALQTLAARYNLPGQLKQALTARVWLRSGAYLVIEPTEALTVIDVNTGKCETGKKKEEVFLKINREAAREAARQIRLRNLSGIILIDFINMALPENEKALLTYLREELRKDPIPTTLVDMTRLSLVEITRAKREAPLHEQAVL